MDLSLLIKRDRAVIGAALFFAVSIAAIYVVMATDMQMTGDWTAGQVVMMFVMWWVMMAAMMLPSAAAVLLLVAALNRRSDPRRPPYGSTGAFAAGYLIAWSAFSAIAVAAQWWLAQSDLLSPSMQTTSRALAGGLLVAAALWQFTPAKQACLTRCRSPLDFLIARRRGGDHGGLRMGVEHGFYCLGCCWLLMTLLFVGGVMNLWWIAGIAAYVAVEKLGPAGQRFDRWAGVALLAAGVAVLGTAA